MAVVRRSLDDDRRNTGRIDRNKLAATTEADIRRHMIADAEDPDAPLPRELRRISPLCGPGSACRRASSPPPSAASSMQRHGP